MIQPDGPIAQFLDYAPSVRNAKESFSEMTELTNLQVNIKTTKGPFENFSKIPRLEKEKAGATALNSKKQSDKFI